MKIEIEATGTNVETMLAEYMRSMTPASVMARLALAAFAQARAEPRALGAHRNAYAVMWGAFGDWAETMRAKLGDIEGAAYDASETQRKIGETADMVFASRIADAIAALAK